MAINGKTQTTVEGLVTSPTTTEGNFRTGLGDIITQVNANDEVTANLSTEQTREYGLIRDLRAGNWNYITRVQNSFSAATKLAMFGSTVTERAGRYRFMVVGAGGGGRAQDGNTHWGGGAGGMVAFDYVWDGVTAPTWTVGDGALRLDTSAGGNTTMTLSNGVVLTGNGGGSGYSSRGTGGTITVTNTHSTVTNILQGIGGQGGWRNGSGDSAGGGAVNVFSLGSDHTATEGRGGSQSTGGGGSVWGSGPVREDGTSFLPTTTAGSLYYAPSGQYMGSLPAGGSTSSSASGSQREAMSNFGYGSRVNGSSNINFPGMFGGLGVNITEAAVAQMFGGAGGGSSSPGLDGVICWCRMGAS
jgi:hypothetical protein